MAIGTKELLAALKIDPEFEGKIPPLTNAEFEQLSENILEAGEVYEPIRVWNGVVVDGHNRLKVIRENHDIKWSTRDMEFADKWAAFEWMYKNQLGRRNLTDENRTYCIGKMYEARKNTKGGDRRSEEFSKSQNATLENGRKRRVDEIVGEELGVNHATVSRSYKFAQGVDALREVSEEAADKVLSGKAKITKKDVSELSRTKDKGVLKEAADAIINGKPNDRREPQKPTKAKRKPNLGYPSADRELMQTINEAYAPMVDPNFTTTYNIDDLIEEIELNGETYINSLRSTIKIRTELLKGNDEAKQRVFKAIANIIQGITRVRGEYTK